jgi:glycosyltransferase involved in cell wall biosynthesis
VVTHDRDGLLVEFGDVPALAASLKKLLDDRSFATSLGEAGRTLVRNGYRWDDRFVTLSERVEKAIESRRGRLATSA